MSDLILHPAQSEIFQDLFVDKVCRYSVPVCARGFGKSYLAGVAAIQACDELMAMPSDIPNKNVFIIAPTYDQVVDIYHPLLAYQLGLDKDMGGPALKHSKDSGRFWLPNNTELRLISYEAVERMRGKGAYFVVGDEVSSWTKGLGFQEAWESVIQPCITTRWSPQRATALGAPSPGRALIISTPNGYNYLYDMFNRQETDSDWKSYHYDYKASPYLDPDEIEKVKHNIDPLKFAREYLASFDDSGNTVFYCFDRKTHVDKELPELSDREDVHVSIDFNVGIMAASVFTIRGSQMHIIDEMSGHPDTETLAIALKAKYVDKGHKTYAYPDPSGKARKSSAPVGVTDFTILQQYGLIVRAHNKAPPIADSVNAVNKKLKTAAGTVDMYIHPKCVNTIKSLERTTWVDKNPETATIDKSEGVEHWSDGLRYAVEYLWPIKAGRAKVSQSNFF